MHRSFRWFFQNRETGATTVALAPNPFMDVIVAGALIWV